MAETHASNTVIKITLAGRGLEAWAKVTPPRPVSRETVRAALQANGVIEGIDEVALKNLCEFPPDEEVLIAQGVPPVHGDPARIDYLFMTEQTDFSPLEDSDGRVDFREGKIIQSVVPGQVLARKIPATAGYPGRSVTGEVMPANPGKDAHLMVGKNVTLSPDKLEATAAIHGIPELAKNRLSVQPVFSVHDVDFSVGNINFQGSVLIRGTVHAGFTVRATDDISVEGNIEHAVVQSGGTIRVRGGVRSGSQLTAVHDIQVRFCDSESELKAGNEIQIADSSFHCNLEAGHKITVNNRLIGGTTRATEIVQVMTLGNLTETATRIELVQQPATERLEELNAEIAELESNLAAVTTQIQQLMTSPQEDGPKILQRLTPQKVNMNLKLGQLQTERKDLLEMESNLIPPRLIIKGEAYPGVSVHFSTPDGEMTQRITTKLFSRSVYFPNGVISGIFDS